MLLSYGIRLLLTHSRHSAKTGSLLAKFLLKTKNNAMKCASPSMFITKRILDGKLKTMDLYGAHLLSCSRVQTIY